MAQRQVDKVVLSHPWKSEWGTLVWLALSRGTPAYHMTNFNEGVRIRRFWSRADYLNPVEHLPWESFASQPANVRARLVEIGYETLSARSTGKSSDVNARHAYQPERRISDRIAARQFLSGQTDRPVVLVMGHVWYDFPHTFAMANFTDFLDWAQLTLDTARQLRDAIWLIKPHPTERWYGGFSMSEVARDLPEHVKLLPVDTDAVTALACADAVVTVHGTGALEATAAGIPVIVGDRSYYTPWQTVHAARDRNGYIELLGRAHDLPRPDQVTRDNAAACFALALGEPPPGAMRMSCDSLQWKLNDQICDLLFHRPERLAQERNQLRQFLAQTEIDSFGTFKLLRALQ
ncbi:MAG: hypothetical protein JXO22_05810 [Phycisphaerae bacterium]|nr:hypothetical protein [Phycisphaerae bacterium]